MSWRVGPLAALLACSTPASTSPARAPAEAATTSPEDGPPDALRPVRYLPDGPAAFSAHGTVAVGAGAQIVVYDADGTQLARWEPGFIVQDLGFSPDESVWVLGSSVLARLVDGAVLCTAALEGLPRLLELRASGDADLSEALWSDGGAQGRALRVHPDCAVERGENTRRFPTAISGDWVARSSPVAAGPTRQGGPRVGLISDGEDGIEVFAETPTINAVDAIAADADHVLVLGEGGAWQLWRRVGATRIAEGRVADALKILPLGSGQVALGRASLDLATGAIQAEALPAPAIARSPDGRLWVLGEEGQRQLWRREGG